MAHTRPPRSGLPALRRSAASRLVVVVALAVATLLAHPVPTGAGGGPPTTVTIATELEFPSGIYVDCDGVTHFLSSPTATLRLDRTGSLASELTVGLEASGSLTDSVTVPATATFAVGEGSVDVEVGLEGGEGGSLVVTVASGSGYTPGSPASADLSFTIDFTLADCTNVLALANAEQTIQVGERPTDLDFGSVPTAPRSFDRTGDLPPGLDLAPAVPGQLGQGRYVWSGAATTVGTFTTELTRCFLAEGLEVCDGRFIVSVTVVPVETRSTSGAGPARAVRTTARFTG